MMSYVIEQVKLRLYIIICIWQIKVYIRQQRTVETPHVVMEISVCRRA